MNKRILVIGSNSFCGSSFIASALDSNHNVIGTSRSAEKDDVFLPYKWCTSAPNLSNFAFFQININKQITELIQIADEFKPHYIINYSGQGMVAESWKSPLDWYETNLISQIKFFEELRHKKYLEKYIHFTTPEVYGDSGNECIKESHPYNPSTPYAISKAACDMQLKAYFEAYKFPVILTRAANVYGPGQQLYRIMPKTILCCINKKILKLHGSGNSIRSFIHIDDVNSALLTILKNADPGSVWNISTNNFISIRKLVQTICEACSTSFEQTVKDVDDRLGKDFAYKLDSSQLRNQLNWIERRTLHQGIDDVIKWVQENNAQMRDLDWNYAHSK